MFKKVMCAILFMVAISMFAQSEISSPLRFKSASVNLTVHQMMTHLKANGFRLVKKQHFPDMKRTEAKFVGPLWKYKNVTVTVMYKDGSSKILSIIPQFPSDQESSKKEKTKEYFYAMVKKYGTPYRDNHNKLVLLFKDGVVGYMPEYGNIYFKGQDEAEKMRAELKSQAQQKMNQDDDL